MYSIIIDNEIKGYTESPRYIKISDSGSYVECDESEATGIAFDSVPYNLLNKELEGSQGTCIAKEIDNGSILYSQEQLLTEAELALCELYESIIGNSESEEE